MLSININYHWRETIQVWKQLATMGNARPFWLPSTIKKNIGYTILLDLHYTNNIYTQNHYVKMTLNILLIITKCSFV